MDTNRPTQKQIIEKLAALYQKDTFHDYSFESLFDPMNLIQTIDLAIMYNHVDTNLYIQL